MKNLLKIAIASLFVANALSASSVFSKPRNIDVKNGEKLYDQQCSSCHGPKGMSAWENEIVPPLNGQYATYMVIQLQAFADDRPKHRRDSNNSAQMIPFAKALSTQEMWDISTYLENIRERREVPKEWYKENKEDIDWAFVNGNDCKACHGKNRAGRYPSAPKLAGLPVKYLQGQMAAYASGERRGGQSTQMKLSAEWFSKDMFEKMFKMFQYQEGKK